MSGDKEPQESSGAKDPFGKTRMSLGGHIDELRSRLIRGVVAVLVCFVLCWSFQDPLIKLAKEPHYRAMSMLEVDFVAEAVEKLDADPELLRTEFFLTADPEDMRLRNFNKELIFIAPAESFLFRLKVCLYLALIVGAPFLLWQMWLFIAAGLYEKEKRGVRLYFPVSLVAFLVGTAFGFRVMVPYAIYFLNQGSIDFAYPTFSAANYLKFFASLCLALGIIFQLPLVMCFLARSRIVDPAAMARFRGHFIISAFVLAAVLTPPDPFTQAMMGIPLIALYEIGIWSSRIVAKRAAERDSGDAP